MGTAVSIAVSERFALQSPLVSLQALY
jgi:hypothetical protein